MNQFQIVWIVARRARAINNEFNQSKKIKILCVTIFLSGVSEPAVAATATTPITPENVFNIVSAKGADGVNRWNGGAGTKKGGNGEPAYQFTTKPESTALQNKVDMVAGSNVYGGNGGSGGGRGGTAILGSNLTLTNSGNVYGGGGGGGGGGDGGSNALANSGGNGGTGGSAIIGDNIFITNSGKIYGGGGGGGGGAIKLSSISGSGGIGGSGGSAIEGSNLTISNSGEISAGGAGKDGVVTTTFYSNIIYSTGSGGYSGNGGSGGFARDMITPTTSATGGRAGTLTNGSSINGAAVLFTGGSNTLNLDTGSLLSGNVSLTSFSDSDSLTVNSRAATVINGDLRTGSNTSMTLTGATLNVSGDVHFDGNNVLTLNALGKALKSDTVTFNATRINTIVPQWNQTDYVLIETTSGISGEYTTGSLSTSPQKLDSDYASLFTSADGKSLMIGLKWNSTANATGEMDIKNSDTFHLVTPISDKAATHEWDGKTLTKLGGGTLELAARNTYTGATLVNAGTLKTGVVDAFAFSSGVTVSQGATLNLGGNSQTMPQDAMLVNAGKLLINDDGAAKQASAVTLAGNLTNSGSVILNNCTTCAGQTLNVLGNWVGNGGTLSLGTVLGADDSLTDKLVIGGNATGTTMVKVTNEGGGGGQTLNGLELIHVGGISDATAFTQSGRITAGAYDYRLVRGNSDGTDTQSWFLTSSASASTLEKGTLRLYRPEAGSYASNLQAANSIFNTRMKDREGNGIYVDPITGMRSTTSLWTRVIGGHNASSLSKGKMKTTANRTVFQFGGDLLSGGFTGYDEAHIGLMAGYGIQNSNTRNGFSGYRSKGNVSGYSTGFYGTWYQNGRSRNGLYADGWILYNWFSDSVKGVGLAEEKYKSRGITGSLESGYSFTTDSYVTDDGMKNTVFIIPQAQVQWSGVKADDHTELSGTQVQGSGSESVHARLGVRLSIVRQSFAENEATRKFEPFIEANWLYAAKSWGVNLDGEHLVTLGTRNVGELKTGVEGSVSKNLSVWGNVAQQMGRSGYHDTKGVLGVKVGF